MEKTTLNMIKTYKSGHYITKNNCIYVVFLYDTCHSKLKSQKERESFTIVAKVPLR